MTRPINSPAHAELITQLEQLIPKERVLSRLIDRLSYAADAGFYQLLPEAVVLPESEEEIASLFRFSQQQGIPLTFRAGGTSLSGQAITDGLLVDISRYWRKVVVENNGAQIRVQPGVIGAMANAALRSHRRKIGPDPASINSAMMGGILSNNASGMCCGVAQNSYHTLRFLRFMLPNGASYSTETQTDYARFTKENPELAQTLLRLQDQVKRDEMLRDKIRDKYRIKNTVGYAMNALLDFEQPLDIFAHLLIGAEGTLAFVSEAVMNTVPDYPFKSTGLLFFRDIYAACQALEPFTMAGAKAIELMDRASLRSVENIKGVPSIIRELPPEAAALLIEFQGNTVQEVDEQVNAAHHHFAGLSLLAEAEFSTDPQVQALYWKVRKGLFPTVGAVRARGTTVILEDVAVPVPHLGQAISDLQLLFTKYAYHNAIIFGHAKDGNIHFVVTQTFDTSAEIERYDQFIREVVTLVVAKYNGSLKAEHGTGRNMAPFVETEWGPDIYKMMLELKSITDPAHLLNPGVIIHPDATAHIQHLKKMPQVEEEVDRCIECGFCEHRCPSRDLTMTPRRRIVVRRALQQLRIDSPPSYQTLLQQYQYDGLDTCAVDGLCATACPVDIDTGKLVKRLRKENHGRVANRIANSIAKHFSFTAATLRMALGIGQALNRVFGKKTLPRLTRAMRKVIPSFPLWTPQLAPAPSLNKWKKKHNVINNNSVVYFPACINRLLGNADGSPSVVHYFSEVATRAGVELFIPKDISGSCCGQIFSSKGFNEAYRYKANEFVTKLWNWTNEGKRPVVIDFSSCVHTSLQSSAVLTEENRSRLSQIRILETVQFMQELLLPTLPIVHLKASIVLHPVCSLEKMGIQETFRQVATAFAEEVIVPQQAGCCGMAGDRGFLFPELTASACAPEAAEVKQKNYQGYYSTSKTCEMALSDAVGKNYSSIMRLAYECSMPKQK